MKEQLVSYELAKLAKEKGFDIECDNGWHQDYGSLKGDNYPPLGTYTYMSDFRCKPDLEGNDRISAPTQSLLQKWLRENNIIVLVLLYSSDEGKIYRVLWGYLSKIDLQFFETFHLEGGVLYKTYEEALEKGLEYGLNLIK